MEKYNFYCTREQVQRAIKLGAPIEEIHNNDMVSCMGVEVDDKAFWVEKITVYQMLDWLREKGIQFSFNAWDDKNYFEWIVIFNNQTTSGYSVNLKEMDLDAIDAALTYLEKVVKDEINDFDPRYIPDLKERAEKSWKARYPNGSEIYKDAQIDGYIAGAIEQLEIDIEKIRK